MPDPGRAKIRRARANTPVRPRDEATMMAFAAILTRF